jgi:BlaI family penicillinase repressor
VIRRGGGSLLGGHSYLPLLMVFCKRLDALYLVDVRHASQLRCDNCHMNKSERLTRREREIMNAIFALGNHASAEDIRARLHTPPSYSSVRVMLTRLEKKGLVKHQEEGLRYMYSATTSPSAAKRNAVQQLLQTFFGGSLKQMMTALVREESWEEGDLDALRSEIERIRKERKKT